MKRILNTVNIIHHPSQYSRQTSFNSTDTCPLANPHVYHFLCSICWLITIVHSPHNSMHQRSKELPQTSAPCFLMRSNGIVSVMMDGEDSFHSIHAPVQ